ncbi:DUF2459 domain-containing protein [Paraburkholderia humisilvae]|uniref:DUF2459 domain-containing protein n=1 Tax=Paraburkholderia humisilvae TaxID=627669 RepID=A0A6J5F3P5_9BURK|nr:DUF2459 domain-containing protein [Paraburkholderia humisilvae]CAB3773470.1 hypothetical protein LMG29542_07251 [Paraburkholderia humisilvae]
MRKDALAIALFASVFTAGCATTPIPSPAPFAESTPPVTTIAVVRRDWHTDVCIHREDAAPVIGALAVDFDGARFLCFGFGERRFVFERDHGVFAALGALFPSHAALLMTVLRATPQEAFGASSVIDLRIGEKGRAGLNAFLQASVQTRDDGAPVKLGDGPYQGSVFFAATFTYDAFHTCNTWTARALRAAGLPVSDALFAGGVMHDAAHVAASQAGRAQ